MHPLLEVTINGFILANIGTLFLKDKPLGQSLGNNLFAALYGFVIFVGCNAWLIQSFSK